MSDLVKDINEKPLLYRRGYQQGRLDTLDEIKEALERRLYWENEFYKMAIRHSIELLDLMRSQTCE